MGMNKQEMQVHALHYVETQVAEHNRRLQELQNEMEMHRSAIRYLHQMYETFLLNPPEPKNITAPVLTKDLVRITMQRMDKPLQTVEIIDMFFYDLGKERRAKMIKTLSVMLNQMERDGEITSEKKAGVKGNFYSWKQ
ncbi:MAG TPA: hypothetical protein VHB48_13425 [Chitinophagaceae bacterium]|jgi:hypothetical protein|nr:hypothetical protein [Chitinophagaceae bacterium]